MIKQVQKLEGEKRLGYKFTFTIYNQVQVKVPYTPAGYVKLVHKNVTGF